MFLNYKYKLKINKAQYTKLDVILQDQRFLYNAALQERIDCYTKTKKSITLYDQYKSLTEWRHYETDNTPSNLQRWTLKRLHEAFNGFFRRLKTTKKAGFPRFRSRNRWMSFGFAEWAGIRLIGNKIHAVRVHECLECGLIFDRDVNASRNILSRAVVSPKVCNVILFVDL